jgi:hypothetical protein
MQCWRQVVWTCEAFEPLFEQWHCSTTSQVRAPTAAIEATTSSSRSALIGIDPLVTRRWLLMPMIMGTARHIL